MGTHNMFYWRNKKKINTLKKNPSYLWVFILNIRTSALLIMLVLKIEQSSLLPVDVSKNAWMSGNQCRPRSDAAFSELLVSTVCAGLSYGILMVNTECSLFISSNSFLSFHYINHLI